MEGFRLSSAHPVVDSEHIQSSRIILFSGRRNQRRGSPMDVRSPNQGIIIVPDENSCKGSGFNDPIEIDDKVEFLRVLEVSRGSNRKHPIIVEQEGLHQAWASSFLRLKPKRSHSFKKPLVESPWAGKPVIQIGESSGTSLQEKLEMEFGVSSGSFPISLEPDFNCEIRMESKYPNELFAIEGCSHIYCSSCVNQYVAGKVEENVLFIKCPDPNCIKGKLEPASGQRWMVYNDHVRLSKKIMITIINNAAAVLHAGDGRTGGITLTLKSRSGGCGGGSGNRDFVEKATELCPIE
ncbi:hypothetical protein IEQ34_001282 [Dendrobium chrysotoxum]|uniref:RING-type domain-containing protein n=1 Tax=Dendrobium chrysotoxum TaxID=161865 RepID=A0AAV7H7C1_DENCH|nr:hypothetical protein IEQ34_001282 [Dendrobium chrysotoxum]